MKKITYLLWFIILISCTPSKEEALISNHEQTLGNTKINLNLKFEKVEFVRNITSRDSLVLLKKYFTEKQGDKFREIESIILDYKKAIAHKKEMQEKVTLKSSKEVYQRLIDSDEEFIISMGKIMEVFKGDCKGTFLEGTFIKVKKLETNLDSVLAKEYNVVYKINNPALNSVEQTIAKTYYFNSDITKVLKKVEDTVK